MGKRKASSAPIGAGARWSSTDLAVAGAVAALAVVVRANTLQGAFIWDDQFIVGTLDRAGGFSPGMLFRPSPNVPGLRTGFYRPLELLLYGISWQIGARDPTAYHGFLVGLHGVVAAALTLYAAALFRVTKRPVVAAPWAGLCFAVLPIHTQAVAWVVGCTDVICAGFLIGAAAAGFIARNFACGAVTGVCVLGALLAKESALPAVVFLPLQALLVTEHRVRRRRVALICITSAIAVVIYLTLREVSGLSITATSPETEPLSAHWGPLSFIEMLGWYVVRLAMPVMAFEELFAIPSGGAAIAIGTGATAALVAIGVYAWRRGDRVALIAGAWVLLFLAPALSPQAAAMLPLAIHRLYIPSVGWTILLANWGVGCAIAWGHTRVLGGVAATALAALAVLSWQGSMYWRDELRFWTGMVAVNPGYAFPLTYLGESYLRAGNVSAAMEQFGAAAQGDGSAADRARPLEMSATVLQGQGNLDGACDLLDRAVALIPEEPRARRNAAACRAVQAINAPRGGDEVSPKLLDARKRLTELVRDAPNDASTHRLLGEVLLALGDLAGGRKELERTIALSPHDDDGRQAAASLRRLARP